MNDDARSTFHEDFERASPFAPRLHAEQTRTGATFLPMWR